MVLPPPFGTPFGVLHFPFSWRRARFTRFAAAFHVPLLSTLHWVGWHFRHIWSVLTKRIELEPQIKCYALWLDTGWPNRLCRPTCGVTCFDDDGVAWPVVKNTDWMTFVCCWWPVSICSNLPSQWWVCPLGSSVMDRVQSHWTAIACFSNNLFIIEFNASCLSKSFE